MLDMEKKHQFSRMLLYLAEALDISESRYQEAVEKYKAVGKWLGKEDSPLAPFNPDIHPQGSFALGTVVKPVFREDEYDIDLVCRLSVSKNLITQQHLKKMVGYRLKENRTYAGMLEVEGRKCWTLHYADGAKFHLDILPAIPDDFKWLVRLGVPYEFAMHAMCITDKEKWHLDKDWPRSNPKGYAQWFRQRMITVFKSQRRFLADQLGASIEDVPDYKVKTPLQRTIQILKRHRDVMFTDDPDGRPISIIITTLAAQAYNNETNLYDALMSIVTGMPKLIRSHNGILFVSNPVNPQENFADKWREHPDRANKFQKWLIQAEKDISSAVEYQGTEKIADRLKLAFGERAVNEATFAYGQKIIKTAD